MDAKYAMDPKQFPWKLCKEIGSYLACYDGKIYQCKVVDDAMEVDEEDRPVYHEVDSKEAIIRWNALCENNNQPEKSVYLKWTQIQTMVSEIQGFFKDCPSLEDTADDISIMIPRLTENGEPNIAEMLKEWESVISYTVEKAQQATGTQNYHAI